MRWFKFTRDAFKVLRWVYRKLDTVVHATLLCFSFHVFAARSVCSYRDMVKRVDATRLVVA